MIKTITSKLAVVICLALLLSVVAPVPAKAASSSEPYDKIYFNNDKYYLFNNV